MMLGQDLRGAMLSFLGGQFYVFVKLNLFALILLSVTQCLIWRLYMAYINYCYIPYK